MDANITAKSILNVVEDTIDDDKVFLNALFDLEAKNQPMKVWKS